jgi:hypothetical protein
MHVIAPFSRCVHPYPIPLRARGGADWETPFSASFPALRLQSTSTNHSISMGSERSKAATRVVGGCRLRNPIPTHGNPGNLEQFCGFGLDYAAACVAAVRRLLRVTRALPVRYPCVTRALPAARLKATIVNKWRG